jgi:predicted nucleic acid-binding protein
VTPGFLLDTGPLVASLDAKDRNHVWAKATLAGLPGPALTCEAVISEACFLLRRIAGAQVKVLALVERGAVVVSFRLPEEAAAVRGLMARYADVPMSFADACLVRMSELHPWVPLATLDSDFRIYRRSGRRVVPTLMPDTR